MLSKTYLNYRLFFTT